MDLTPNSQATLLLTCLFSKQNTEFRPLTNKEWGELALWLRNQRATPADLLHSESKEILFSRWINSKIPLERLNFLLSRGHALALAMEKWQRAGLWVITRSDPIYPIRLKLKLKDYAPPYLFGSGNIHLMSKGGLAIVGSRHASDDDLTFTKQISLSLAHKNINVISGAARGIDETAMLSALENKGSALGIVADSLIKLSTSKKWRSYLMNDRLSLISPFNPEAGFSVGNAMARNKYIYCLSDLSLVVHSGLKGGTFSGAKENLDKCWTPVFVKKNNDKNSANQFLINSGGILYTEHTDFVNEISQATKCCNQETDLFTKQKSRQNAIEHLSLETNKPQEYLEQNYIPPKSSGESLDSSPQDLLYELFKSKFLDKPNSLPSVNQISKNFNLHQKQIKTWLERYKNESPFCNKCSLVKIEEPLDKDELYRKFLLILENYFLEFSSVSDISDKTNLTPIQIRMWLTRAIKEKRVEKASNPVRYRYTQQMKLF